MLRQIIKIDQNKCNGCGLCVLSCHEGAIGMIDGKAILLRDDYCDGLGNCLPACPTEAISFEEREALAYNEEEVKKNLMQKEGIQKLPCSCPGIKFKTIKRGKAVQSPVQTVQTDSQLNQWPIQIKLVPINATYFKDANLFISADCAAYAYGNFHNDFMQNKITLIGCPKLDEGDYSEKLEAILKANNIKSVTVARMEVPCCGGIENAVKTALQTCGKMIPWRMVIISTDGRILEG